MEKQRMSTYTRSIKSLIYHPCAVCPKHWYWWTVWRVLRTEWFCCLIRIIDDWMYISLFSLNLNHRGTWFKLSLANWQAREISLEERNWKFLRATKKNEWENHMEGFEKWVNSWLKNSENATHGLWKWDQWSLHVERSESRDTDSTS